MKFVAHVEYVEERFGPDFTRAVRREILRRAFYMMALNWQNKYLPRHFEWGNTKRYNLRRRTKAYRRRKRAMARRPRPGQQRVRKGGAVPLVLYGKAEELFSSRHAIKATPTRAQIKMHGPRYIAMRPRSKQRHAIGPEILKDNKEELEQSDRDVSEFLDQEFTTAPRRRRTRRHAK